MDDQTLRGNISSQLSYFGNRSTLRQGAIGLLNSLGYFSNRTVETTSVGDFVERITRDRKLTPRQISEFDEWSDASIVFQLTSEEIVQQSVLRHTTEFESGRVNSFLFLCVDLVSSVYTRTRLAESARIVNRLFAMPVVILYRHGEMLTIASTHRRSHKKDEHQDVVENVTLIKDVQLDEPRRADIDILSELALPKLIQKGVRNFDELHEQWEQILALERLNQRFYIDLFKWFERACDICRFPDDSTVEGSAQRHVIRLVTRLLFIWFLKEKSLVPDDMFTENFASDVLKSYSRQSSDYYRAVLQNIFFATLNTEIDSRCFAHEDSLPGDRLNQFCYSELISDPESFVTNLEMVPFVNGGLFDCLDVLSSNDEGDRLIDVFTDVPSYQDVLYVPAHLFFDDDFGLFSLFNHYKFTVEESTPLDQEVALDPELLGRVFENLLAAYNPETRQTARKMTGSYYTPRRVVDYMVRESLKDALVSLIGSGAGPEDYWREKLGDLLDHSTSTDYVDQHFPEPQARITLVNAIAELKTLDPAVGSGAFPMGILQTLTMVLRRIDPSNVYWERVQKRWAQRKAILAFNEHDQVSRDEMLNEISATFEKYRQTDYGRKLYLIQNGIFGVDIQPIACQIAKLRFFISLIVEQDPDYHLPNLGIKPLPNLETHIVAADTLVSVNTDDELLEIDDVISIRKKNS